MMLTLPLLQQPNFNNIMKNQILRLIAPSVALFALIASSIGIDLETAEQEQIVTALVSILGYASVIVTALQQSVKPPKNGTLPVLLIAILPFLGGCAGLAATLDRAVPQGSAVGKVEMRGQTPWGSTEVVMENVITTRDSAEMSALIREYNIQWQKDAIVSSGVMTEEEANEIIEKNRIYHITLEEEQTEEEELTDE